MQSKKKNWWEDNLYDSQNVAYSTKFFYVDLTIKYWRPLMEI